MVCGRKLNVDERHLCVYCLSDMPLTRFWTMKHNPMADRFNEVLQSGLEKVWDQMQETPSGHERYAYASALFFYDMEAEYRHIPHQIKYHGNISAGRYFGNMLGRRLAVVEWFSDVDVIIPVPLHWRRRWSRGYNQAEIIASGIAAVTGVPVRTDVLKRIRKTETQTKLDVSEKVTNVSGAFAVATIPDGVRHVLLVDDVFTTGSTLGECFSALRSVLPPDVRISVATLGFVG